MAHDHSSPTCYVRGCREPACRARYLAYRKEWQAAQLAEAGPDDPRHGTTTFYSYGCRCTKCTVAQSEYNAAHYAAKTGATQ